MKNFTVRAFVLTLAIAGAVATSVSSASTNKHMTAKVSFTDPTTPAPVCKPSDPSHCGMDGK